MNDPSISTSNITPFYRQCPKTPQTNNLTLNPQSPTPHAKDSFRTNITKLQPLSKQSRQARFQNQTYYTYSTTQTTNLPTPPIRIIHSLLPNDYLTLEAAYHNIPSRSHPQQATESRESTRKKI